MANPTFATRYRLADGRLAVNVTEDKVLAAEDSGIVQNVIAANVTVTTPATTTVGSWTVRDGGVKQASGPAGAPTNPAFPKVDCATGDTVAGLNYEGAEADGKYLTNTGGRVGDEITITNIGATNGGFINTPTVGDWPREA